MTVTVHPRVEERHPELSEDDVLFAWTHRIAWGTRMGESSSQEVCVGVDPDGRLLEMVAVEYEGDSLIFHAMTPPSKKTLKELGLTGGRR